ncbi:putative Arf-GAP with Rho-GAP domain, ANK repeat and PH domain-containing protein 1 [Hypsibius exemplaris]|uniref:Arf-GAP with Rho-GAP domain, ANK repeat and PH domain-containing protein 1 n=1 Tax=Hypsibius exemplaris TaxID=2072580 RepID=A0A1W0WSB1_HYPEX|nr:putative Arf-GAP with Rho-GAP domain, ANK repeat and PH domain-containing protein 1 [Hypsibius exemplaris]
MSAALVSVPKVSTESLILPHLALAIIGSAPRPTKVAGLIDLETFCDYAPSPASFFSGALPVGKAVHAGLSGCGLPTPRTAGKVLSRPGTFRGDATAPVPHSVNGFVVAGHVRRALCGASCLSSRTNAEANSQGNTVFNKVAAKTLLQRLTAVRNALQGPDQEEDCELMRQEFGPFEFGNSNWSCTACSKRRKKVVVTMSTGSLSSTEHDDSPPPLPPPAPIPKNSSQTSLNYSRRPPTAPSVHSLSDATDKLEAKPRKPLPAPRTRLRPAPPPPPPPPATGPVDATSDSDGTASESSFVMVTDLDQSPEEKDGYLLAKGNLSELPEYREVEDTQHIRRPAVRSFSQDLGCNQSIRTNSDLIKWESMDYLRSARESLLFMQSQEDPEDWTVTYTPPSYSPPPPPLLGDADDAGYLPVEEDDAEKLVDVPPPIPPRPLRRDVVVPRPLLPQSSTATRSSAYFENETRNGVTTLRTGNLIFRNNRCWCALKDGKFSAFADRKALTPKLIIACADILEISTDKKTNSLTFGFEIHSVKEKYKPFVLQSESAEDRAHWLQSLAKCVCDALAMHATIPKAGCKEFDVAGKVYVRRGASGPWKKSWIELAGRTLSVFSDDEEDECDLRKVVAFSVVNAAFYESKSAAVCPDALETSNPFIINLPGRVLYVQADLEKATTHWMKLMQQRARECGPAIEDQPMTSEDVPVIVQKCIEFVSAHGVKSEGIYRHCGVGSRIAAVLDLFAKDAHGTYLSKENFSEHDVAGALKRFFRNLPEPVITLELYQPLLHCAEIENVQQKLLKIPVPAEAAPTPSELCDVEEAARPSESHNGIGDRKQDVDTQHSFKFRKHCKRRRDPKGTKNFTGSGKLQQANFVPAKGWRLPDGHLLDRPKGEAINMRLKTSLTAGQLCRALLDREKMEPDPAYTLHEVIFDDKLSKGNHFGDAAAAVQQKKSFKKMALDFSKMNLTCYKNLSQKLLKYQSLLKQLPLRPNFVTLKKLLGHLRVITELATENKMSIPNIASSFGSTVMSGSMDSSTVNSYAGDNFSGSTKEITVLVDFLTFYEVLFEVKDEEIQKERKILQALESFNKQILSPPRAGDFLMGIYWIDRKGEAINMRLKTSLTAGQLCRALLDREKMEPDPAYTLHEVIFDDKLYRPVLEDEEVIPIILRWTQWNETNICPYSANYLCVRKNEMQDKIAAIPRATISVTQQLRFSKEKSFKKMALDFSKMNLTCYKNLSGEKSIGSWRIEDIVWFRGCSPQRSPPSKWTFTFIEKQILDRMKENRAAFGYTVCCDEEADLFKWIGTIVQAQQSLTKSPVADSSFPTSHF